MLGLAPAARGLEPLVVVLDLNLEVNPTRSALLSDNNADMVLTV